MNILKNSKIVFLAAVALALIFPDGAAFLKPYLLYFIVILMTLSMKNVAIDHINKNNIKNIIFSSILYYIIVPVLYIVAAKFLISNPDYEIGLILMAFAPPATIIIALSHIMHAEEKEAIVTELFCFALSLIFIPLGLLLVLGVEVHPLFIAKTLGIVVLIPLLLSHVLHFLEHRWKFFHFPYEKEFLNIICGLNYFVVIGINKENLLNNGSDIFLLIAVIFILRFGLGTLLFFYYKFRDLPEEEDILRVLFSSFRNGSIMIMIALIFFDEKATLPMAVSACLEIFYVLWLEFIAEKYGYHITEQKKISVWDLKKLRIRSPLYVKE